MQRRRRRPSHYHRLNEDEERPLWRSPSIQQRTRYGVQSNVHRSPRPNPGVFAVSSRKKVLVNARLHQMICTLKYTILRQPRVNWYRGQLTNIHSRVRSTGSTPQTVGQLANQKNSHHFLFGEHNKPRRLHVSHLDNKPPVAGARPCIMYIDSTQYTGTWASSSHVDCWVACTSNPHGLNKSKAGETGSKTKKEVVGLEPQTKSTVYLIIGTVAYSIPWHCASRRVLVPAPFTGVHHESGNLREEQGKTSAYEVPSTRYMSILHQGTSPSLAKLSYVSSSVLVFFFCFFFWFLRLRRPFRFINNKPRLDTKAGGFILSEAENQSRLLPRGH